MTQSQLLLLYISEFGSVIPAKMCGEIYRGQMCGSDFPKRARELRAKGILRSEKCGKFEKFYLKEYHTAQTRSKIILPPTREVSAQGKLI